MSIRTPVCLPAPEQDVFQPVFTAAGGRRRKPVRAFCRTTARNLNHASTTIFTVLQERALRATSLMRSAEHTSELQSLMRISYAVLCLKKNNKQNKQYKQH